MSEVSKALCIGPYLNVKKGGVEEGGGVEEKEEGREKKEKENVSG
jgi:hypothetical protein